MDPDPPIPRQLVHPSQKLVQWNVHAALDLFLAPFPRRPDIQHEGRFSRCELRRQDVGVRAFGPAEEVEAGLKGLHAAFEITRYVVESDPPESQGRLLLPSWLSHDSDGPFTIKHRSRPRRVLAAESDVDAAREVPLPELSGLTNIQHLYAFALQLEQAVQR